MIEPWMIDVLYNTQPALRDVTREQLYYEMLRLRTLALALLYPCPTTID